MIGANHKQKRNECLIFVPEDGNTVPEFLIFSNQRGFLVFFLTHDVCFFVGYSCFNVLFYRHGKV